MPKINGQYEGRTHDLRITGYDDLILVPEGILLVTMIDCGLSFMLTYDALTN